MFQIFLFYFRNVLSCIHLENKLVLLITLGIIHNLLLGGDFSPKPFGVGVIFLQNYLKGVTSIFQQYIDDIFLRKFSKRFKIDV